LLCNFVYYDDDDDDMWRPCATDEGRPSKYFDTIWYDTDTSHL